MGKIIPYARQYIDEDDIATVVEILKSEWLTQGPVVPEFEQACAAFCGAKYALAVNSATSALHLACLALGLAKGDILWTSPNTFVASSNCALYCDASVDFVDIDEKTYNMSLIALQNKLEQASKENRLPKIVVAVHFAGQSCDMREMKKLADQYSFKLIEDASHAIGGKYLETLVGSCAYSDIAIFSFHPVKILTTGEGGMVLTNQQSLIDKVELLRTHGVTRKPEWMQGENQGAWYYEQVDLGFNYRMTDIQAGLGLSQLKKIEAFVTKRNEIAKYYDEALSNLPVIVPWQSENNYSAFHLYPIQLKLDEINKSRKEVFDAMRTANIGVNVHYIPVHTQPYYQQLGFQQGDFPVSEAYYEKTLSLPMYYSLSQQEQNEVIATLSRILVH